MSGATPSASPASAREAAYRRLRAEILSLELPPGTAISEKDVSLRFGVSRTPVRECFVRLAQEGLLDIYPQRGTYVSRIDAHLVEEARFLREQLEAAVVRLAAADGLDPVSLAELEANLLLQQSCLDDGQDGSRMFRLDEEFHARLFAACGKSHTWSVIGSAGVHLNRSRRLRLAADPDWRHLLEQHRAILQAIRERAPERAERVMREHLQLVRLDRARLAELYPDYFRM
ncbi:GntR family transcriptional regulator [Paenibacillus pasadenensis]|uniref:Transcriptional regulator, GntR family n=1 Tax=Paenibacillus pasadenensis TaxID=217090 RepID=A0A2N5N183_9BACL|nr:MULTISPECIES: GntR family transcriptional regulator [Paenibacillus]PLT44097.1 Transcriptional regulator, GntR family [Paenibacillus pasadenensis]QGG54633.1 FCD domain-containing protein [Paenibacillus sp. B01]